jgi:SAM-dependent methyltransferase
MYHLDAESEKERYLSHHNDEGNIGYVTYLTAFIETSVHPLTGVKSILDFGSGPYPMLQKLLQQEGYTVDAYDPFFLDNQDYLTKQYDLIILTEVLEHIFDPLVTLQGLLDRLNPGGRIVIMTQFRTMDETEFLKWWYRRDPTHVGFYHQDTFTKLAQTLSCTIENSNNTDRITFQR